VRNNLLYSDTEECPMCTVSDLIQRYELQQVDLLKIDVEGAEVDVLLGVKEKHWPLIQQVLAS
jgi:FkbM family methyltransferase